MGTVIEDWLAINRLLLGYAELLDAGRFVELADLFEHATYRIAHAGTDEVSIYRGSAAVLGFCRQTRLYADGTPRTRHLITNVAIDLDGDRAESRSYATVLQQTDDLPLQPIASGRYVDQWERVDGCWRWADRLIADFLLGDRSQHVRWHEGVPNGGAVDRKAGEGVPLPRD